MGIFEGHRPKQSRASASAIRFEPLEPRLLLAATPEADLTYIQETYHGTPLTYDFEMFYSDDVAINASTLDSSDIRVLGPGYDQTATFLGTHPIADPRFVRAVYRVNAPGGFWNYLDNGAYTFIMQPNQVADNVGNFVETDVLEVTTVDIEFDAQDLDADVSYVQDPYHGTPANLDFEVTYESEDFAVNTATLDSTDILVAGPKGAQNATFLGIHPIVNPMRIKAVYRINPPDGTWDETDNGAYTMILQSDQVADTNGNAFVAQALDTTVVDLGGGGGAGDVDADVSYVQDPYHGTPATLDFEARFQGDNAIDTTTLGTGDFLVVGPNGYSQAATFLGPHPVVDPTDVRAVYRIGAPGGTWDIGDNGVYTIIVQGGQIFDVTGASAPAEAVETTTVELDRPEAHLNYIQDAYHGTPPTLDFEMRYTADLGVDTSTLDSTDIQVIGPTGTTFATFLGTHPVVDPREVRAVYRIPAPGGGWDPSDNGIYTLNLQSDQVFDLNGTAALFKTVGTTEVDVQRPEAKITYIPASYDASYSPLAFEVRYWGSLPIDTTTIDSTDLRIIGPNGYDMLATLVGLHPIVDPTKVFAVYSAPAPVSGWNSDANGTYTVSLQTDEVADTSGSFALAKALDTFKVEIDRLEGEVTYIPPTYKGTPTTLDFEMRYTADLGVDTTTIDSTDIRVTGPNGYDQDATLLGLHPVVNPRSVKAVYRIEAPGGVWDVTDNGTYTLFLQDTEVFDLGGLAGLPVTLDTTNVDIGRPEGHMSYIQDPYHANPTTLAFDVRYKADVAIDTSTIGTGDVQVTGPGINAPATFVGLQPIVDPTEVHAVYTVPPPGGTWDIADNGAYSFLLLAGQVADAGGATNLAKTLETITVDIDAPEAKLTYIQPTYRGTPATLDFEMRYWGDRPIDTSTIGALDVRVIGPGYDQYATFVGLHPIVDPNKVFAVYRVEPPGGAWGTSDNGTYTLLIESDRVFDVLGIAVTPVTLDTVDVDI